MTNITVDGITYTFTKHALLSMSEDNLTVAQVEEVMSEPDRIEPSKSSANTVYIKALRGHDGPPSSP